MKKIILLSILTASLIFPSISNAQCGFDVIRTKQLQNSAFNIQEQANELKIKNFASSSNASGKTGTIFTIPVVVHVLHKGEAIGSGTNITDAQIQSGIDRLNEVYRGLDPNSPLDFEIQFTLAKRDSNCNATTGINRVNATGVTGYSASGVFLQSIGADENTLKDLSRWPETDYLNIWIVSEIDNNGGGSGIQGYANFFNGNAYEGSVMMYTVFGYDPTNAHPSWPLSFSRDNSTPIHEFGHYFHLYHTFQGDDSAGDGVSDRCPNDVGVGAQSDGCADTETHKRLTSTCPTNNTCNGNIAYGLNTRNNYMSYFSCTDRLTANQKTRVTAAMTGTSIVGSKGSVAPDPAYAAPVAVCAITSPQTSNSGILNVELNGLNMSSGSSSSDGGSIDKSANCSNYFEIDASVSNTINVDVFSVNFQQLGVWIDWNNDGDFNDNAEQQHLSQDIAAATTVPIVLTYPTIIPYDDYVRIRLITDIDNRYGAPVLANSCSTPQYGQSEDYTIYVQPSAGCTPPAITSNPVNRTICANTNTTYVVAATDAVSYQWQVNTGAGFSNISNGGVYTGATLETLTITGATSGMNGYTYKCIATGSCAPTATSTSASLTVNPTNTASAASSTPTLCISTVLTNITHNTTSATGIGAATGFPAGVTVGWASNTITISGTPTASGTFNYSIPLTGGCGTINATGTITVTPNKTVSAASSTPTLCINTVLTNITHTTTGATGIGVATGLPAGVTAGWAANTITISGTPTASGTFSYSIPLSGGCGTVNAIGTITVTPLSGNAGVIAGSASECENATGVAYSIAAVTNATGYVWTVPTGATITSGQNTTSIVVTFGTTSGNVGVTPSNSCNSGSASSQAVTINVCGGSAPVANFSANTTTVVAGGSVNFTDLSTNIPTSWSWDFGDGGLSSSQNTTYTFNTPGTYTVTLTATNASGFDDEIKVGYITVSVPGGAVANTKLHSKSCGITVADLATPVYANAVPSATAYTFEITNSSLSFSYEKTNSVNYFRMDQIPGVLLSTAYSVKVKATVGASTGTYSDSCTVTTPNTTVLNTKLQSTQCGVTVNSLTTPIYASPVAGATVYYFQVTNTQNNFVQVITSYGRYFRLSQLLSTYGGVIHNVRVKVVVGGSMGNYGATCTITDGAPISLQDGATVRLANNETEGDLITPSTTLSIYPNPNSGEQLNVSLENLAPNSTLTITDIYGKTIVSKVLNTDLSEYNVNVKFDNKLTAGLYFITLTSNENRIVEKLVVR